MTAPIRVEDFRGAECVDGHLQCFDAMKRAHGIDHGVRHDLAVEQIHNGNHERLVSENRGIGDVRRPYLIRMLDLLLSQQIGKLLVIGCGSEALKGGRG